MAQKGDRFDSASKFGPVVQFDTAETQRTLGFGENTYQGRILKNWDDALGTNPAVSVLTGLRISGFGTPSSAPAPGTANATLMQFIKQIEIDLVGIKGDTAALRVQLAALATVVAAISASTQSIAASSQATATSAAAIAASTSAIATSTAATATSTAATATSTAAIAATAATITAQQVEIIALLTAIRNKP